MKITIWGCRGSLPSPGPTKLIYGGNTSCVQVEHGKTCFILDGGSGIQNLLPNLNPELEEINVLLTHLHLDHIMGLGYFLPFYNPNYTVNIYGPSGTSDGLIKRLRRYFSPPLFPVRLKELPATINFIEINNSTFKIGDFTISTEYVCHPGPTVGYRCQLGDRVFAYMPDHEPALGSSDFPNLSEWSSGYNIAHEADLLFHDGQYRESQYNQRIGWGHSSVTDAIAFGKLTKVKKMVLFHHDPINSDIQLDELYEEGTKEGNFDFECVMAKENDSFELV